MEKNILVAAATAREIAPFLDYYRRSKPGNIDVLITGVGLMATAWQLSNYFRLKRPGLVIQAGIAGCFDKKITLGTVVAVKQEVIADEGVITSKSIKTVFDLKLADKNKLPYSQGWLLNKNKLLQQIKLKKVRGVSVNQVTSSEKMAGLYSKKFNPVVESMEGAAIHYVCLMEKIPFVQLRSVSNYAGDRNKKNWQIKDSVINLNAELINLINKFTN